MNVLIGDASSYKAIVIAKYLKLNYNNIKIIGFDKRPILKYLHSKYFDEVVNWDVLEDLSFDILNNIIRNMDINIMIPVNSHEITLIMENKCKIDNALNYVGSIESYNVLNNKDKLNKYAMQLGIKTPKIYENYKDAKLPFVVKPTNLSSSKGVVYIKTEEQKSNFHFELHNNMICQEYVEGEGIGYSLFAKEGKVLVGYGHKRIAEHPSSGGSSVYREYYVNKDIENNSKILVEKLNWSGFVMFEFKLTKDNNVFLIESNPRVWGSINQGLANNINYFEPLFGETHFATKEINCNTYLSPLIYFSFIQYIIRLNFKPLFKFLLNVFKNKSDVSIFKDFWGWLSMFVKVI